MRKYRWLPVAFLLSSACSDIDTKSCKISCATDADCPSGLACGDLGLCAASDETCSCSPGEFIACDAESALFCNPAASGITNEACGPAGCNADAQRCNACIAGATGCSTDLSALDRCGSNGLVAESTTCAAGCIAGSPALDDDRCGHIEPAWIPDVCDAHATTPTATLTGTLDVQQDAACTGGVRDVNGTMFCIVRAASIAIGDLKVSGTRAIAFVADDELKVTGILDVSADGATGGPGAGGIGAGAATINSSYKGGGGAGFAQMGGAGGGNDTGSDSGMAGGPITDRLTTTRFIGGASTTSALCGGAVACLNSIDFPGGGGGGGALLIACRGTVKVTGTVDAGGGGGTGGGDHYPQVGTVTQGGAPGGGSGGFVVFQGVGVEVSGRLYANGGGGGAACSGDNCRGMSGSDGSRSTAGAPGGDAIGNTCGGGIGGSASNPPGTGEQTFSNVSAGSGGGGGSTGRFQVFTPNGRAPVLSPTQASPSPEASTTSLLIK